MALIRIHIQYDDVQDSVEIYDTIKKTSLYDAMRAQLVVKPPQSGFVSFMEEREQVLYTILYII
jgi:hypothetical protein